MQIMFMLRTSDITPKYCTDAMFVIKQKKSISFFRSRVLPDFKPLVSMVHYHTSLHDLKFANYSSQLSSSCIHHVVITED